MKTNGAQIDARDDDIAAHQGRVDGMSTKQLGHRAQMFGLYERHLPSRPACIGVIVGGKTFANDGNVAVERLDRSPMTRADADPFDAAGKRETAAKFRNRFHKSACSYAHFSNGFSR